MESDMETRQTKITTQIEWQNAQVYEQELLRAMCILFAKHPELLWFVFDPHKPKLADSPEKLIKQSEVFSSGEQLLVQIALDLWNGSGGLGFIARLGRLDSQNFDQVIQTLRSLGPKPTPSRKRPDPSWDGHLF